MSIKPIARMPSVLGVFYMFLEHKITSSKVPWPHLFPAFSYTLQQKASSAKSSRIIKICVNCEDVKLITINYFQKSFTIGLLCAHFHKLYRHYKSFEKLIMKEYKSVFDGKFFLFSVNSWIDNYIIISSHFIWKKFMKWSWPL